MTPDRTAWVSGIAAQPFEDLMDVQLHIEVERCGSVRLAAKACEISQPAASRRLHLMERRSAASLYEMGPHGTALTASGAYWLSVADKILTDLDRAVRGFEQFVQSAENYLRIVTDYSVSDHLLPLWIVNWNRSGAHKCDVEVGNYTFVRDRLHDATTELIVQATGEFTPDAPPGFTSISLLSSRLALVVSRTHDLAASDAISSLAELSSIPLIRREAGSGVSIFIDGLIGDASRSTSLEFASAAAVKEAVVQGLGPAIVPLVSVERELSDGVLVEIPIRNIPLPSTVWAIYRTDLATPAGQSFIRSVREFTGG